MRVPVDLEAVSVAFGLPRSLEVVSHHPGASGTWRLRSRVGNGFALKVLTAPDDRARTRVVHQGQLELAASAAGVAMPEVVAPLSPGLGLCADVDGQLVEVHRWVDTLSGNAQVDPPALLRWLGRTLALLHGLVPLGQEHEELARAYAVPPVADWTQWVCEAQHLRLPWSHLGSELVDVVPAAAALVRSALDDAALPRCLTHRDVNPPNVLHTENGPVLCDFGSAGPDIAWLEVVSTAASFNAPDLLPAYVDAGGRTGPTSTVALARAVGSAANWLAFTMRLSLGHHDTTEVQRREATDRVPGICREVIDRVTHQHAARHELLSALAHPRCAALGD